MNIILIVIIALSITLFCIRLLSPLALKVGFVDRPGGRKQHQQAAPLIGGIAVFFGFCFTILFLPVSLHHFRGMFAGAAFLLLMGIVDDFHELSSKLRLAGQLIAACAVILWGHHHLSHLGDLFFVGDINLKNWSWFISVIAIVGFMNAMNMIDGQDGLLGGVAVSQALLLTFLSICLNLSIDYYVLIILITVLCVFLCFNMPLPWRRQASIFMGDSGSTVVAFLLAWFAITIGQKNLAVVKPITVLWVLSFPVFDLINVFFHRLLQGKSPFLAGRDHVHHILHIMGFSTTVSTLLLCGFSILLGIIGIVLNYFNVIEGWQFLLWIVMLSCYFFLLKIVRDQQS